MRAIPSKLKNLRMFLEKYQFLVSSCEEVDGQTNQNYTILAQAPRGEINALISQISFSSTYCTVVTTGIICIVLNPGQKSCPPKFVIPQSCTIFRSTEALNPWNRGAIVLEIYHLTWREYPKHQRSSHGKYGAHTLTCFCGLCHGCGSTSLGHMGKHHHEENLCHCFWFEQEVHNVHNVTLGNKLTASKSDDNFAKKLDASVPYPLLRSCMKCLFHTPGLHGWQLLRQW